MYVVDIGTNIGELLKEIIAALPEEGVMLRVGMTNPPYILEHLAVIAGKPHSISKLCLLLLL
jgi:threonylcarbamoyladenosine tRNA methylthiotransferase CDKAL1